MAGAVAAGGVAGFAYYPDAFIVWLIAFGFARSQFGKGGPDKDEWRRTYNQNEDKWDRALAEWRRSTGLVGLIDLRLELQDVREDARIRSWSNGAAVRLKLLSPPEFAVSRGAYRYFIKKSCHSTMLRLAGQMNMGSWSRK